jgi:hypothetical protein
MVCFHLFSGVNIFYTHYIIKRQTVVDTCVELEPAAFFIPESSIFNLDTADLVEKRLAADAQGSGGA